MKVRLIKITEQQAMSILRWSTHAQRSGIKLSDEEEALAIRMLSVLRSFEKNRKHILL